VEYVVSVTKMFYDFYSASDGH